MCVRSLSRLKSSHLTIFMILNCGLCTEQCPRPGTRPDKAACRNKLRIYIKLENVMHNKLCSC